MGKIEYGKIYTRSALFILACDDAFLWGSPEMRNGSLRVRLWVTINHDKRVMWCYCNEHAFCMLSASAKLFCSFEQLLSMAFLYVWIYGFSLRWNLWLFCVWIYGFSLCLNLWLFFYALVFLCFGTWSFSVCLNVRLFSVFKCTSFLYARIYGFSHCLNLWLFFYAWVHGFSLCLNLLCISPVWWLLSLFLRLLTDGRLLAVPHTPYYDTFWVGWSWVCFEGVVAVTLNATQCYISLFGERQKLGKA